MICIVLFVFLVSDLRPSALSGPFDVSHSMFDLRSPPHRFMKVSSPCNLGYTEYSAYLVWLFLLLGVFKVNTAGHCTILKGIVLCTGRTRGKSSISCPTSRGCFLISPLTTAVLAQQGCWETWGGCQTGQDRRGCGSSSCDFSHQLKSGTLEVSTDAKNTAFFFFFQIIIFHIKMKLHIYQWAKKSVLAIRVLY